jgi:bidirectional [NiFe] hydrogenase diaphorase subunit
LGCGPRAAYRKTPMSLQYKKPPLPSQDSRWRQVKETMQRHGYSRDALIETLHTVQECFGYIEKGSLRFVAESLRVPLSQAYGVVTFYHYFTLKPPAAHGCMICLGTACYLKGGERLLSEAEHSLGGLSEDVSTRTPFSVSTARCIGACGVAPIVELDGETLRNVDEKLLGQKLEDWKRS